MRFRLFTYAIIFKIKHLGFQCFYDTNIPINCTNEVKIYYVAIQIIRYHFIQTQKGCTDKKCIIYSANKVENSRLR